ncbi:VCBS repeat-containing protein, partial [Candidatus Woesearchaeota archaeon]|nr:VCBS repeat-containing protein [Candidatus Woesearchaeota archaeon]
FNYESSVRPDRRLVYEQGNLLEESRRLTDITVYTDNSTVRRYHLEYTNLNPSLSSLSGISYYGSDNISLLHNITFTQYTAEQGYTNNATMWVPPVLFSDNVHTDYGARRADVNNDGFADIIQGRASTSEKKVWINNRTNGWALDSSWNVPDYIVAADGTDAGVRFADVNNDGFTDFLKSKAGTRAVYLNNGTGWNGSSAVWNIPIDFVDSSGNDLGVVLDDVDRDNRIDIVKSKDSTRTVYLNNGSSWVSTAYSPPVDLITGTTDTGARLVDVNGDGLPDFLRGKDGTRDAWLNNGTGWVSSGIWSPPTDFTTATKTDNGVRFADVNGDGLTDLIEDFANGSTTSRGAWLNTGSGWQLNNSWQSPEPFTKDGYNTGRRLADIDGDGFADVVVSHQDSSQQYSFTKNATLPYLLRRINNEYGGVTLLNYTTSTRYNNSETGRSDIGFNLFVVSNVTLNNSLNDAFAAVSSTSYNYSFGKYNYEKAEFRGFGIATERKPSGIVRHYFYQDSPRRGKEYRTEVQSLNNSNFSITVKEYNYTYAGGIYNLSLLFSSDFLYDGASAAKVTNRSFVYDYYENLLSVRELGDVSVTGDERTTNSSYALGVSNWILDKVASVTLYDADKNKVKDTKYYYDSRGFQGIGSTGDLTKVERWDDGGNNSFAYYTYDSFGNVLSQTDSLGNTQKYTYDATHT